MACGALGECVRRCARVHVVHAVACHTGMMQHSQQIAWMSHSRLVCGICAYCQCHGSLLGEAYKMMRRHESRAPHSSGLVWPVAGRIMYLCVDSSGAFAVSIDSLGSANMQQIGPANDSTPFAEGAAIMPSPSPAADAPDSAAEACQVS